MTSPSMRRADMSMHRTYANELKRVAKDARGHCDAMRGSSAPLCRHPPTPSVAVRRANAVIRVTPNGCGLANRCAVADRLTDVWSLIKAKLRVIKLTQVCRCRQTDRCLESKCRDPRSGIPHLSALAMSSLALQSALWLHLCHR